MDALLFCLQSQGESVLEVEQAILHETISEHNWLYPDNPIAEILIHSSDTFSCPDGAMLIPVGSIEFVEQCLTQWYGVNKCLSRLYIPEVLRSFANRWYGIADSKEQVKDIAKTFIGGVFLKSASKVKCDYAGIYHTSDTLPDDTAYFVSEVVDIRSEWRVFVYRGKIMGIQNYAGDFWKMPDKEDVCHMVQAFTDAPNAYTLDVAVLEDGTTAVIEVHNFLSCGLYGFKSAKLPQMYRDGILWELEKGVSD